MRLIPRPAGPVGETARRSGGIRGWPGSWSGLAAARPAGPGPAPAPAPRPASPQGAGRPVRYSRRRCRRYRGRGPWPGVRAGLAAPAALAALIVAAQLGSAAAGWAWHAARSLAAPPLAAAARYGPAAGLALAAAALAYLAGRAALRRRRQAVLDRGARLVTVLAPPQASPDGAVALWGHLTGLLRPAWARRLRGQPHLCLGVHLGGRAPAR